MDKVNVAVFFGGKSFEHDVSILTGLEACYALDTEKYNLIPVYVDLNNHFWTGDALLDKNFYPLNNWGKKLVNEAKLIIGEDKPTLEIKKQGMFAKTTEYITFDVALLAFHGEYGENGPMQGLFEVANIPYTGCRTLSAAVCMNKSMAKTIVASVGVPVLPEILIKKPTNNDFFDINEFTKEMPFDFPVIVKPVALGSSVGVSKANNKDELNVSVLQVFTLGEDALIEPFVENLEEYNISVTKALDETIKHSIIEHPLKKNAEFLGFVEKYLSNSGTKGGVKKAGSKLMSNNEKLGMISLTRDFTIKELTDKQKEDITNWALNAFEALECNGIVRIDFMYNSKTKEFYFTEANTIPGSFAYYLWEASEPSYTYTDLMTALINEALELQKTKKGDIILSSSKSSIFKEKE